MQLKAVSLFSVLSAGLLLGTVTAPSTPALAAGAVPWADLRVDLAKLARPADASRLKIAAASVSLPPGVFALARPAAGVAPPAATVRHQQGWYEWDVDRFLSSDLAGGRRVIALARKRLGG